LEGRPPHEQLTKREHEVFLLLLAGHSNTVIAEMIHRNRQVVTEHKRSIMTKLKLDSLLDLYAYGIVYNLVKEMPSNMD
jgi:DNA-binding NarL/FixJ family response regulator